MHLRNIFRNSQSVSLFTALAVSAVFTTGCANLASTATGGADIGSSGESAAVIGGHIHGGIQPVTGASVKMYTFGNTGYGSAATQIGSTTSANDAYGSWSFTSGVNYSCPDDSYVYVVAKGGDTQGDGGVSYNNDAAFVAVLGPCKEMAMNAPFTNLNEVTTVATMAALQQFYSPVNDSFGGNTTGIAGTALTNAASLVNYMANLATGTAVTSKTMDNSVYNTKINTTGISLIETPESSKINTLANILASCINTSSTNTATSGNPVYIPSSNCSNLYSMATPPVPSTTSSYSAGTVFNTATDVLQALYYLLSNPTNANSTNGSNIAQVFAMQPGTGAPFQPSLSSVPNDWTISITYTTSGGCSIPATTNPSAPASTGAFISSPHSIATDSSGSVWFTNTDTGYLTEFGSPVSYTSHGGAQICAPTNGAGTTSATVLDSAGNYWGATSGAASLVRLYAGGSKVGASYASTTFPITEVPLALTADGKGNIFYSTSTGNLYILTTTSLANYTAALAYNATTPAPTTPEVVPAVDTKIFTGLGTPTSLAVDNSVSGITGMTQAIWVTTNSNAVYRISGSGTSFTGTMVSANAPTFGIAVTNAVGTSYANNVFTSLTASGVSSAENLFGSYIAPPGGTGYTYAQVSSFLSGGSGGGLNTPRGIATDSRSNVWIANSVGNSVSEFSASGVAKSPSTGFLKDATSLNNSQSIAIDISGNVWVGGDGNNFITEIVGAASPVYQPFAVGLYQNSVADFQQLP